MGSVSPITHVTNKRNFLKKDIPFKTHRDYQLVIMARSLVLFAWITAAGVVERSEATGFPTEIANNLVSFIRVCFALRNQAIHVNVSIS